MFKRCLIIMALLSVCYGTAVAQEKSQSDPAKAPGAEEKITVEVYFALEHVPAGLKAGAKLDLKRVNGKAISPTGKVSYITVTLAPDIEVTSITQMEKPSAPEQAVKVDLRATKDQAALIEKTKAQLVTWVETTPQGSMEQKKKPVAFRLELTKPEKK